MERQYSLTSSAIVFHINLGKNDLSTFWLWSCTTQCFIELWWDFWWICAINSFHANSGCWTWFKGTDASSSQKTNIPEWWQSCSKPVSAVLLISLFLKTFFFRGEITLWQNGSLEVINYSIVSGTNEQSAFSFYSISQSKPSSTRLYLNPEPVFYLIAIGL